ncbi:Ubiquitin carboxyl-terminal hydrolase isozyme L3 [Smittium mucronatum]|uniref:ubiquitinyl hydrolase 1 n=1 Tax=Smittium mucronatum TaxID=133383 RepID=A0A1R0GX02_9FUNG|nr:Ubiquitin carboxyl-terminal hydrolase isozyme L3 [Smittium mucronatum]OLY81419.1 Ubiquitin carboxyl-terminal hydrolase isozyme L3 [Smittium mucronatum]
MNVEVRSKKFKRMAASKVYWAPLESNPESMNTTGPSQKLVPHPLVAYRKEIYEKSNTNLMKLQTRKPYLIKQTIGNACGTIAMIHSLANNMNNIQLEDGVYKAFMDKTKDMTPKERCGFLESNVEFSEIHSSTAASGQSEQIAAEDDSVDLHFVAFTVDEDGNLVELDGSLGDKNGSDGGMIVHKRLDEGESLISASAGVIKRYMELDPSNPRFSILSLSPL